MDTFEITGIDSKRGRKLQSIRRRGRKSSSTCLISPTQVQKSSGIYGSLLFQIKVKCEFMVYVYGSHPFLLHSFFLFPNLHVGIIKAGLVLNACLESQCFVTDSHKKNSSGLFNSSVWMSHMSRLLLYCDIDAWLSLTVSWQCVEFQTRLPRYIVDRGTLAMSPAALKE